MAVELSANPYPGLRPFETEEDYLFFGRDGQSEEILSRLRRNRLVAVVGTSGSGKSSLIRAGLLPYVYGGFMAGAGSHWRVAVMRPGGDPIRNLAKALYDPAVLARPGKTEEEAAEEATVLEVTLRRSGLGLIEAVRQAKLPETDNVLIVVDQFEELFRFAEPSLSTRNEDDAAAFVKLLLEAVAQTGLSIYVVLTMRSDFIGDCARYRDLPESIAAGLYLIPRMTRDQRREAIERPARVAESQISPRLMNRLLNDGGDNPDQLPILQHALMRTWDYWRRHRDPATQVDLEDYKAIGEMEEALSIHAEEAYAELPDERSRMIAKRMFQALTEKGEDNREIRRPTSVGTIAATAAASVPEVIAVIDYFRRPGRSFLTPPANVPLTASSVIDISHESLIRGWERLNRWVDEETESTKVYLRLAETAALEEQHKANLWRGSDLSTALAWREKENPTQEWGQFYHPGFATAMRFLDRSAAVRRQTIAGISVMAVLAVAGCLLLFYTHERNAKEKAAVQSAMLAQQQKAANDAKLALADHEKQELLIERDQAGQKQAELLAEQNEQETEWVRQVARSADVEGITTNLEVTTLGSSLLDAESPDLRVDTLEYRGEALSKMGEHEKAVQAYSDALLVHPEQNGPLGSRGYEYILMGRAEDALKDLKTLLQHDPHSFSAQLNRAVALGMLKRYPEAEADVESAISDYQVTTGGMFDSEVSPDIKRATGQSMVVANAVTFHVALYYEAASLKAFAGDPGFLAALDRADRFAQKEGFYSASGKPAKSSVDPFVEAIEWAWLSARAQGIGAKGNDNDYGVYAIYGALWERAGRIQPRFTDWAGHFYQAFEQSYAKHRQKRYDRMDAWAKSRTQALYPATGVPPPIPNEAAADASVLGDEASLLEDQSDYEGSARILTEAIKVVGNKPDDRSELVMLLLRRARMYIKAKKWELAEADSKRVLQYAPNTAEAYLYLGNAETDEDARIRDYTKAEDLNPTSWAAKYYLASALEARDPKRALAVYKAANRGSLGSSEVYRGIARLQNQAGDYKDALAAIDAAIAMDPDDDTSYAIRDKAEEGLGVSAVARAVDRAAATRARGEYLARMGQTDRALQVELQALRQLATATAGNATDSARAEETVSAYTISQWLQRMGSRQDAKQFWATIQTSAYFQPISDIAQHEETRLSTP
jgi:tetratricopeptide (TPR) repeat protein/energy-coupling factor transporter ATP-binding protein EcfA2